MRKLTKDELAVIYLDQVKKVKIQLKLAVLDCFEKPGDIFDKFVEKRNKIIEIIGKEKFDGMSLELTDRNKLLDFYHKILDWECDIAVFSDDDYPDKLRELGEPPLVLYYRGNLKLLKNDDLIMLAGTRHTTSYGVDMARNFTKKFIENDLTILCGISDGIDTAVLETVKAESGKAVVICAGGIDKITPVTNTNLENDIEKSGLVVSEFPPNESAQRYHYIYRNRLLAMLANAVILAEADEESNSIGAINLANEYGKEVFAIPGNLSNKYSVAPNRLIANNSATCLVDAKQVVEIFRDEYYFKPTKREVLNTDEIKICEVLENGSTHFEEIVTKTKICSGNLVGKLLLLEAKGKIRKLAGNNYELVNK